jgi:hypothetical protein
MENTQATIKESIQALSKDLDQNKLEEELKIIVAEVVKENPHLNEAGITGWVIDKVANGLKWATNRKADYQYDALLKSKQFKSLAKDYNMNDEDWDKAARELIKKDPKRLAKILAYDLRNRKASTLFKQ